MTNEREIPLDRNGYAPSILQTEEEQQYCFRCGRRGVKLDRHELYGGAYRSKSKALGLWVTLCHVPCHLGEAHGNPAETLRLRQKGQRAAMKYYGWTPDDFRARFGKSYV